MTVGYSKESGGKGRGFQGCLPRRKKEGGGLVAARRHRQSKTRRRKADGGTGAGRKGGGISTGQKMKGHADREEKSALRSRGGNKIPWSFQG